ncbi:hypothetical protein BX666DRAFT_1906251 [Dichotomocladium elegans]|nr:hypothetical protein BX666DRAFT_1906251 [Dichotomocladium elegans]
MPPSLFKQTVISRYFRKDSDGSSCSSDPLHEPLTLSSSESHLLPSQKETAIAISSVSDDDEEEEDDDEEVITHRRKRKRFNERQYASSDSDVEPQVRRQQRRRLQQRPAIATEEEENDVDDLRKELDFLEENDVYEERIRSRKQSSYSKALERLRTRKLPKFEGEEGPMDEYCVHEEDEHGYIIEDSDCDEYEDSEKSIDDDFVVDDDVIDGERMTVANCQFGDEKQDAEDPVLPDVFSTASTQKFKTNFHIYAECLVHSCFGLESRTPYFQSSVRVVDRRVQGFKDSVIASDAWRPEFKEALDTLSQWHALPRMGSICQGCRQNRSATAAVILRCDEEDTKPSERVFSLGSECYKRAMVYHQLAHFRSHMDKRIRDEVERIGKKISNATEGPDLTSLVNETLNAMDASGFIKSVRTKQVFVVPILCSCRFILCQ